MNSIKIKLAVSASLLLAGALSLLAFCALVYFENQLKQMISSQQFTMVTAIADQIDDKLLAARTELTTAASTITPAIIADPARARRFILNRPDTVTMFDNGIFLFSPQGRLIAGSILDAGMTRQNHAERDFFRKTLESRRPVISDPFRSAQAHRQPVIAITAPILDANGTVTAILAGGINLLRDNFLGSLASIRLGENGYLYLYSTDRTMIVHRHRERILKRDVPPGVNRLFDRAIEGFEGTGQTTTSTGLKAIASFKRLKSTGWILAANFPESEAFAPVFTAKKYVTVSLAALLLLSLAILWLITKRLTAPLLQLTGQVRELAGKESRKTGVDVTTDDEIGILAEAFNVLLRALNDQKKELQQQLTFSQLLIDTIPNPVFYKDAEGRYLGCNRAFEQFTGHPREWLMGKTVHDVAPSCLVDRYHQADRELFERQGVQTFESTVMYADGTLHEAIFYKGTFSAGDGRLAGLIGTILDITERKRAESALASQKEFAESLVQNSTVPTFVLDNRHRVIIWNRGCEQLTGVKAAEILGSDEVWRAFYPEKRPVLADLILEGRTDLIPELYPVYSPSSLIPDGMQAELWLRPPAGGIRYIFFNAAPIRNAEGAVIAAIETLEDITERKYHEEQLRKLSKAVEQNPAAVAILDVRGRIEYVNDKFTQLTGYSAAEAASTPEILEACGMAPLCQPEVWDHFRVGLQWRGTFLNTRKNGEQYWESTVFSPVKDHNGTITHLLALKVDITEQKKVQDSLRDSEDKLRAITDAATDAIMLVDDERRVVYWNRAAEVMFGFPAEEMVGKKVDTIVPSGYRQAHNAGYRDFVRTGTGTVVGQTREISALRRDGTEFPVELSISAIRLKGRWHAAGIIRDISERKSLESQLRHAQKMEALGTFSGGIAHDFNNILTAITAYCSLIERKTTPDSPVRPYLNKLLGSAERATALTSSLLAYSRKQPMNPRPFDLNGVVRRVEHLLSRLVGEDVELQVSCPSRQLIVLADSMQVEQVLMNLATNARDAMPDGGLLRIETRHFEPDGEFLRVHGYADAGNFAVISVSDTGCGMDPVTTDRMFEPFFTTKEIHKGTGLGLSIVYGIVKQHGGSIDVRSERGTGTTFTIYLPLTEEAVEQTVAPPAPKPGRGDETLLLVEDDAGIREPLRELLENEGYRVIEAVDGEDGIRTFREHRDEIQLLILDMVMPKKNGREVHEEIKALSPRMKAVFISGYTPDHLGAKGFLTGDESVVSKPVAIEDLLTRIKDLLHRPAGHEGCGARDR